MLDVCVRCASSCNSECHVLNCLEFSDSCCAGDSLSFSVSPCCLFLSPYYEHCCISLSLSASFCCHVLSHLIKSTVAFLCHSMCHHAVIFWFHYYEQCRFSLCHHAVMFLSPYYVHYRISLSLYLFLIVTIDVLIPVNVCTILCFSGREKFLSFLTLF